MGVRRLSTLKRGQDSAATVSNTGMKAKQYEFVYQTCIDLSAKEYWFVCRTNIALYPPPIVAQTPSPYTPIYQPLTTTHLKLR